MFAAWGNRSRESQIPPNHPQPQKWQKRRKMKTRRSWGQHPSLGWDHQTKPPLEARKMKKVMLKANPRINPETGVPQTTEVEKEAIQRLLERRGRGQTTPAADSSSCSEEETSKKKRKGEGEEPSEEETKRRRMAKDLVAKKKTGWGKQGQEEVWEVGYCGFPGKRKKGSREENTTEESSLQGRLWGETWRNEWWHTSCRL